MDIGPTGQRDLLRRNHRRRNAFYYRGGLHPDTLDWLARVAAVGGSVSGSTIAAVDRFARSIDAAGIRSSISRLSLFCGNNLTAALVPLYVGRSAGVTLGGAVDINNNFVAADYSETGSSAGLSGNGSNKVILTPLTGSAAGMLSTSAHIGVYGTTWAAGAQRPIGSRDNSGVTGRFVLAPSTPVTDFGSEAGAGGNTTWAATPSSATLLLGTLEGGSWIIRSSGIAQASTVRTQGTMATATNVFTIFAENRGGGNYFNPSASRLSGYTMGLGLNPAGAQALESAWAAFNAALSRP